MTLRCKKAGHKAGVFVETRSGIGPAVICDLAGRNDVRHIVRIENLMTYPTIIRCVASVPSNPKRILFVSPNAGDRPDEWTATAELDDEGVVEYDHVGLLGHLSGEETVRVQVSVNRPQPEKRGDVTVTIRVTN
jgi:hypothetical protein